MKKISITNTLKRTVLAASVIALTGCDLTDSNNNPNASSEVSVSAVLTGAEVVLGFSLGVDAGLVANI